MDGWNIVWFSHAWQIRNFSVVPFLLLSRSVSSASSAANHTSQKHCTRHRHRHQQQWTRDSAGPGATPTQQLQQEQTARSARLVHIVVIILVVIMSIWWVIQTPKRPQSIASRSCICGLFWHFIPTSAPPPHQLKSNGWFLWHRLKSVFPFCLSFNSSYLCI